MITPKHMPRAVIQWWYKAIEDILGTRILWGDQGRCYCRQHHEDQYDEADGRASGSDESSHPRASMADTLPRRVPQV